MVGNEEAEDAAKAVGAAVAEVAQRHQAAVVAGGLALVLALGDFHLLAHGACHCVAHAALLSPVAGCAVVLVLVLISSM